MRERERERAKRRSSAGMRVRLAAAANAAIYRRGEKFKLNERIKENAAFSYVPIDLRANSFFSVVVSEIAAADKNK